MSESNDPMFVIKDSKGVRLDRNVTSGKTLASVRRTEDFAASENVALGNVAPAIAKPSRWERFRGFAFKILVEKPIEKVVGLVVVGVAVYLIRHFWGSFPAIS